MSQPDSADPTAPSDLTHTHQTAPTPQNPNTRTPLSVGFCTDDPSTPKAPRRPLGVTGTGEERSKPSAGARVRYAQDSTLMVLIGNIGNAIVDQVLAEFPDLPTC